MYKISNVLYLQMQKIHKLEVGIQKIYLFLSHLEHPRKKLQEMTPLSYIHTVGFRHLPYSKKKKVRKTISIRQTPSKFNCAHILTYVYNIHVYI